MKLTVFSIAIGLATAFGATVSSSASAYKLYVKKLRIHEQMTERSAQCFAAHFAERRLDATGQTAISIVQCRDLELARGKEYAGDQEQVPGLRLDGDPVTYGELKVAVRWPDDPQRKLSTLRGTMNLGLAFEVINYCRSYTGLGVDEAGLLCVSHFGPMQFLHAMSARADETARDTQTKVLEWVHFAYEYAAGRLRDTDHLCSTLNGFPHIRAALVGSDESFICKGSAGNDPRTVGEFFGFQCSNPFSSATCGVVSSERERRLAALGAILHVIQDSYSQAHAQRGTCAPQTAVIRQQVVERFLNYAEQDGHKHARADAWPKLDVVDRNIHHPVVAGARVLELLASDVGGKRGTELVEDLRQHVFGVAPPASDVQTGPGECYRKEPTIKRFEHFAPRAYRNRQVGAGLE